MAKNDGESGGEKKEIKEKDVLVAIVDDHVGTVTTLSSYLVARGFRTVWAYSGKDAIELCKRENPDIVLLDIVMEDMNGFDVAKELRGQKILFMTAYDNMEEKAKKAKGSLGIIKKPLDPTEIEARIRQIFGIRERKAY